MNEEKQKKQEAQQILAEFTHELRQLLQRYPQASIDRADGFLANVIVRDDSGDEVLGRVHCSEQARVSDERTQHTQSQQ